jgi:hypothetical protein
VAHTFSIKENDEKPDSQHHAVRQWTTSLQSQDTSPQALPGGQGLQEQQPTAAGKPAQR